ncbi:MAG TPA: four helix bundle protein [Candidatus Paceibacterota bacterium]|nr:four helix bundle protein [Candidatus Paceibacterota bacterium]
MPKTNSFKDLLIWQKPVSLAKAIYTLTAHLPRSEEFGLSSQLRRAAVSIPSNIAEGSKRGTRKDFRQFLHIARGSAAELETQLLIAADIYPRIERAKASSELSTIQKMFTAFIRTVN